MSERDLVDAYVGGRISRRTLVRRLVAGGVSLGAAISYAHLLTPERASARPQTSNSHHYYPDYYPDLDVKVTSKDLAKVVNSGKLEVRARCSGKAKLTLRGYVKDGNDVVQIGEKNISFDHAGRQSFGLDVKTGKLKNRQQAKVTASLDGRGAYHGATTDTVTLS